MTEVSIAREHVPLLDVSNLCVHFPIRVPGRLLSRRSLLAAVNGVDLSVSAGQTLAIVGESGCGKSTLAKTLVGLLAPTAGSIRWQGQPLIQEGRSTQPWPRRDIQMIFQDPLACLDPRMTVFQLIAQALQLYEPQLRDDAVRMRVHAIMEKVGLSPLTTHRFPHEFSGGQCQRIGIARALVSSPKLLICDEPVSALDVSIRAQIINLLMDMQRAYGLAIIFIAHDLAVVRHIATRVMVMYLGQAVEEGSTRELFDQPRHPYTRMLLSAVPIPDPVQARARRHVPTLGELPSPIAVPSGCPFHTRCTSAEIICVDGAPPWHVLQHDHRARCHLA
ncbi:MAG: oligopeptide/dipeptide ABC transporter ATP-binding protein [Burkholderiaceae bacterium]